MLMPALRKANAMATSMSCLNNLKQLGVLNAMYGNDYKGVIPSLYDHDAIPSYMKYANHGTWWSLLASSGYLNAEVISKTQVDFSSPSAIHCPAETFPDGALENDWRVGHYQATEPLANNPNMQNQDNRYTAIGSVKRPSKKVWLIGSQPQALQIQYYATPIWMSDPYYPSGHNGGYVRFRHNEKVNQVFLDGHVGSIDVIDFCSSSYPYKGYVE